jgi:VanZ family protein
MDALRVATACPAGRLTKEGALYGKPDILQPRVPLIGMREQRGGTLRYRPAEASVFKLLKILIFRASWASQFESLRMNFRRLLHLIRQIDVWLVLPAIVVVIYGELSHDQAVGALTSSIWDKALHFTAYFGLCVMTTVAVRASKPALFWWALGLVLMGGALEIIQGMTGRDGDIFDELANTIGILTGLAVGSAGVAFLKARKLVEHARAE